MRRQKRGLGWMEYCAFHFDAKNGVIKASSNSNLHIYKVLKRVGNLVFVSMEICGKVWYYTFSLAQKELMGIIECMPIGKSYQQLKRAERSFNYFVSNNLAHPEYSFGKWWEK